MKTMRRFLTYFLPGFLGFVLFFRACMASTKRAERQQFKHRYVDQISHTAFVLCVSEATWGLLEER